MSTEEEKTMSVGDHLEELRRYLVRSVIVMMVAAVVLFMFKGLVIDLIFAPMSPDFPTNRLLGHLAELLNTPELAINQSPVEIINTRMAGQFGLHVKSSLIGALIISFPFLIWQLWLFVSPALSPAVRSQTMRFVVGASVWFFTGVAFGYFVIAPLTIDFLAHYTVSDSIANLIDTGSYLSTVLGVVGASALAFQLPILVQLLATIGIMKASLMRKYRKIALFVILVISSVITPPDVFSMIMIAIPLYLLYEYGITIAERIERRRAQQQLIENQS